VVSRTVAVFETTSIVLQPPAVDAIMFQRRFDDSASMNQESKQSNVTGFRVLQIDHVELFVPDREEAAGWYRRVLGLEVVPEYQAWAADRRGPLMISSDQGNTKLALFEGQPPASRPIAGFHRVAFRVDAAAFIDFLQRLTDQPLKDHQDRPVTSSSVVDHKKAYSVYFSDPYGHCLELTTYEYEAARAALIDVRGQMRGEPR
jgi:catechol 2,3-dioxygenase-like lactoylglutathione lyase family enzyme